MYFSCDDSDLCGAPIAHLESELALADKRKRGFRDRNVRQAIRAGRARVELARAERDAIRVMQHAQL